MTNLFFELIQVAVGTRSWLSQVPDEQQWQGLLSVARMQALVGVLYDGVERLPEEQKPPMMLSMQWMHWQSKIKARNLIMDQKAAELTGILADAGFGNCVLKGQGTALYYPKPDLRKSGDIDIWVEGDRKAVLAALKGRYPIGSQAWHHTDMKFFDGVEVELHHHPSWLCNPFRNKKLQRYFAGSWPACASNASGLGFNRPTTSFAAVYCLVHIFRHLLEEGIGLRQIFDFHYIVAALSSEERKEVLQRAEEFGLMRLLGGLMYVEREVFGMDENGLLCMPDADFGPLMVREMLLSGNFGKYDRRNDAYRDEKRAAKLFGRFFSRQTRFLRWFPAEVLWILPWRFWQFFIWRPLNTIR